MILGRVNAYKNIMMIKRIHFVMIAIILGFFLIF